MSTLKPGAAILNEVLSAAGVKGVEMDKIQTDRERTEVEILASELDAASYALLILAGEAEAQHATEIHKWANDALEMVMVFETETEKRLEEYEER